tara:strand:+ start:1376 stop:2656 length:1281 start_codon:yes stop_codon:yes gene_type:complete
MLNAIIVMRGILQPNCFWWKISELFVKDSSGIQLYNKLKKIYGSFAPITMFNKKIYLVTNNKYITTILNNSPHIFGVGTLKFTFFKSFMEKNVGVSQGCPWKRRRQLNEKVLTTDNIPIYSKKYNNDIIIQLNKYSKKNYFNFHTFTDIGKIMVSKIVFNENKICDEIFSMFSNANSISVFYDSNFKINPKIFNKYNTFLKKHIRNPNPQSLVKLCTQYEFNENEIFHQIPHFIFPIAGLYNSTIPRTILLLYNHPKIFRKVINEIKSINLKNKHSYYEIYKLSYLRKCILETVRLNNPVVTTFRTLLKDFTFDSQYTFKKDTQFVILNNPVLREADYFINPNKFIPSRWTPTMEKSYYSISFNQGPQKCPGKELSIFLCQSFIVHFFEKVGILENYKMIKSNKINTNNIPQMINPCNIRFTIKQQ